MYQKYFSTSLLSGSQNTTVIAVTLAVESAFDSVQNLIERSEERLLRTREKSERQKLKYEIRKLSKLERMTGGGFFEISKSTLTSMVSVRYQIKSLISGHLSYLSVSPTSSYSSSSSSLPPHKVKRSPTAMKLWLVQDEQI